jgi:Leucine-rich repeat (LRR) protein
MSPSANIVVLLTIRTEKLMLHELNLKGTIPEKIFEKVTRLTEIELHLNELSGQIPTTIGLLKDVQRFLLGDNRLGGSLPRQLGLMVDLRTFLISGNSIGGSIPELIKALKDLKELGLARNVITGMNKNADWPYSTAIMMTM